MPSMTVQIVRGEDAIAAVLPSLIAQAGPWQQASDLSELPYYFSIPVFLARTPVLALVYAPGQGPSPVLLGAVLVFACLSRVFGLRLLANADRLGRIGVFGPLDRRVQVAAAAARALVEEGAAMVRLQFRVAPPVQQENGAHLMRLQTAAHLRDLKRPSRWDWHWRERPFDVALADDEDETLAALGKRTRRNFRAAARRCASEVAGVFEAVARPSQDEFLKLNRSCTHPVSPRVARWRLASSMQEGAFLAGLRGGAGEWLALAGGRCVDGLVIVDWQMNARQHARLSLSLVVRGNLMQFFGRRGMRRLLLDGGTSHVMAERFRKVPLATLTVRRRLRWLQALEWVMTRLFPARAVTRSLFGWKR